MKRMVVLVVAMAFAIALFAGAAPSQKSGKSNDAPKYDLATETIVRGVIDEVKDFECPVSGGMGAHLVLKSNGKVILIHLALTKFLKEYEVSFAQGEAIEILGSKVMMDGAEVILARQITRGQNTYTFRDAKGKPLW